MQYSYEVKIPKSRIAVLIGKSGETKKSLEENTKTRLQIDSDEGDVSVQGDDAIGLLSAREIIKAIGRGFNPAVALQLLKQDYVLNVINLTDFSKKVSALDRIKGRVIGKEGKTRGIIEDHTNTHISVYGKTISIIGEAQNVMVARRAIESLLTGSPHSSVYKWLEKKRAMLYAPDFVTEKEFKFEEPKTETDAPKDEKI